ncbi:endonuclease III [Candidatus Profftia sp. (ex Adelges kitamiensis)]|uniref:endonuclease III n=1 Tax=Candidatus Profftia sp. (ex Adelges kitamiensis) TaxID=2864218 RepID=UPI001CE2C89C|nr:endonuclease III [Candidatus Profftia sp. (ex Adelges kitamiensis)]
MNKQKRMLILQKFQANNPYPTTELVYNTNFELLISVLLSAQSTDIRVNKVTAQLYAVANTPTKMLKIGVEDIKQYIKIIGLYNKKAENIIKTCKILIDKYNGKVPENIAALQSLPGVGRKTAHVILNTAFNWPIIAVDTHIFRICNRTKFAPGRNVRKVEDKLMRVVLKKFKLNFHNWFVMHGRYTCTAYKPHCNACIIKDLCEFKEKNNAK